MSRDAPCSLRFSHGFAELILQRRVHRRYRCDERTRGEELTDPLVQLHKILHANLEPTAIRLDGSWKHSANVLTSTGTNEMVRRRAPRGCRGPRLDGSLEDPAID